MATLYKGSKKKTTEMFKEELRALGSSVIILGEYTKARSKIACLCPDCNYEWDGVPNRMLSSGTGCPKCGGRVLPTLEELNSKLKEQGKTFTASGDINRSTDKITATCNVCDHSWKAAYGVLLRAGYSCTLCRTYERENPPEEEQERLNREFQRKLDSANKNFTLVGDYSRSYKPVTVQCNVCERIWTNEASGVLTNGCAQCSHKLKGSMEKLRKKLEGRQIEVFGEYVNAYTKINCACTSCGEQWQSTPNNLSSHGCPFCCFKGRIPKDRSASLYYVRIESETGIYWKIGITTKPDVMERFSKDKSRKKITLLYSFLLENGEQAYYAEKNILRWYKEYLIKDIKILEDGNTEIFTRDVLQMNHLGGDR